jgi:hypothetical protein
MDTDESMMPQHTSLATTHSVMCASNAISFKSLDSHDSHDRAQGIQSKTCRKVSILDYKRAIVSQSDSHAVTTSSTQEGRSRALDERNCTTHGEGRRSEGLSIETEDDVPCLESGPLPRRVLPDLRDDDPGLECHGWGTHHRHL